MAMGVKSRNRFKETSSKKLHNLVTDYLDVEGEGEGGVSVDFHVSDLGNCAVATANERNREVREEGQVGEQRMCSVLDLTLSECELFR